MDCRRLRTSITLNLLLKLFGVVTSCSAPELVFQLLGRPQFHNAMQRSACLTVVVPLSAVSTIHQALTQLFESGVPLEISRVTFQVPKPRAGTSQFVANPSVSTPSVSPASTKASLKRKTSLPSCRDDTSSDDDQPASDDSDDPEAEAVYANDAASPCALARVHVPLNDADMLPVAAPVLVRQ